MKINELLPIGSVVLLNGSDKPLMIFGIMQTDKDTNKEYDYIGVIYPEGNIGTQGQLLFDHVMINKVLFTGYSDESHQKFINALNSYYESKNA